jgi:hypothetical protein
MAGPALPKVPKMPKAPKLPKGPKLPKVPGVTKSPRLPKLPNADRIVGDISRDTQRAFFGRRRAKPPRIVPGQPMHLWRGSWRLVAHTGYREWLSNRRMEEPQIDEHITELFNRSKLTLRMHDGVVTVSSEVRGRWPWRKQTVEKDFVLDGETVLKEQSPLGAVDMTSLITGEEFVMTVSTPRGVETHRYFYKEGRMRRHLFDAAGEECELEYVRV